MFAPAIDSALTALPSPAAADLCGASDVELRAALAATQRLSSWAAAARAAITAEAERRALAARVGAVDTAALLRRELGLSARDAAAEVAVAEACAANPEAARALARGEITPGHVQALGRVIEDHPEAARRDAADLLEAATGLDADRFARHARRWSRAADADGGVAVFEAQRRQRRLRTTVRAEDGMGVGSWQADPLDHAVIDAAITRVAAELWRVEHGEAAPVTDTVTSSPQRRLDALVEICRRVEGASAADGRTETARVVVHVTLADLRARSGDASALAVVEGHGPVPVATARRLACTARIVPAVLGSMGEVLDLGRHRRLASPAQRLAALTEYGGCAFPGCDRPIQWCELHHLHPWENGGPTDHGNLVPLCGRHHHLVHEGGWTISGTWPHVAVAPPGGTATATPLQRRPPEATPGGPTEPPPPRAGPRSGVAAAC
jgi:hypothetical protein